jgi:PKD repeat protein
MQTLRLAFVTLGFVVTTLVPAASRAANDTFVATLVGNEETPPNDSTSTGHATFTRNADDSLTYTVTSTGFATNYRVAHVHTGGLGVAGPILFPISCTPDGTSCAGTSPPLSADDLANLLARGLYVNQHTAAFPGGEIRGQLILVTPPPAAETLAKKINGKAAKVGFVPPSGSRHGAEISIIGRFSPSGSFSLAGSTAVATDFLREVGGDELVRALDGSAALPMSMALVRYDSRKNEAMYRGGSDGGPRCTLQIRNKGRGTYEFTLACKNTDGAAIPTAPQLCSGGSKSTTTLTTTFELDGTPAVGVGVTLPWRCLGNRSVVNQLKSAEGSAPADSGGSGDTTNRVPKADFRIDPRIGEAPLTVNFTNRSYDADGDTMTSAWDFGDGTTSTETSPVHVFQTEGEFQVTLVVTDSKGAVSGPKTQLVTVMPDPPAPPPPPHNSAPRADFRADPTSGTAPLTVRFSNASSDADGDAITSSWDFGDGFTSTDRSPTHLFTSAGAFSVTLVVTDARGLSSTPRQQSITVRAAASGGSTGTPGTPGSSGPPTGGTNAPRADFRADPASGTAPLTVRFSNRSSDPDGDTLTSSWDFGDGFTSTDPSPAHVYTRSGEFTATLVVTDAGGHSSAMRRENITVRPAAGGDDGPGTPIGGPPTGHDNAPRADFRADPASGTAPVTVHFTNRSSDLDGDALESSWDFGDGFTSSDPNPTHIFTSAGEFTVTLVVTDPAGLTSEPKRESITVRRASAPDDGTPEGENRPPRADFRADPMSGPAPLAVHFTNRSADPDGDFMVSNWDLGDGTFSTEASPTHTYTSAGDFTVTLQVSDGRGGLSEPKRERISVR